MNLTFILWLILWPLSCRVGFFLNVKSNNLQGKEPFGDAGEWITEVVETLIWVGVSILLWRAGS